MAESSRQFSLRHIKHESKLNSILYSMLLDQHLVDVLLCCDGTNISAHRLILSANSSYFKSLFDSLESNRCQIPIIILKDVPLSDLRSIMEFMYKGEVSVEERHLSSVLKSAELLKVFGLTEVCHALRSRLNNESNVEPTPIPSHTPQKRPRISDGIPKTTQPSDLFSRLSNARFEIRPTHSTPISQNQQQLRSVVSTANSGQSPTFVKNVILPLSQIHRKTDSNEPQLVPKQTKSVTNIEAIRVSNSPEKSPPLKSPPYSCGAPVAYKSPIVKRTITQVLSATWTPSQQTSDPLPSNSQTESRPPIELIINDETNEAIDETQEDIKPPIFELNKSLNAGNDVVVLDIEDNSSKIESKTQTQTKPKPNTTEIVKFDEMSSPRVIKSRSASISSQSSLPPPPSYRVVQRSSSRLLRNIIKPTSTASTSMVPKGKDVSDDKNKPVIKRERQLVRMTRPKVAKPEMEPNIGRGSRPEVECPSCGLKFNDEKKWNEHITSAHPPAKT